MPWAALDLGSSGSVDRAVTQYPLEAELDLRPGPGVVDNFPETIYILC